MKALTKQTPRSLMDKWFKFNDFDELFDDFFTGPFSSSALQRLNKSTPSVDIYEEDNNIILSADLPGLKVEGVNIEVKDNVISIKGEKKEKSETKNKLYHRVECSYGSFSRSFTLPDNIDEQGINASYNDGVLKISIPKLSEKETKEESKKIPIKTK